MRIGKGVDCPVQYNALPDTFRVVFIFIAPDTVCHKIAQGNLIIPKR